MDVDIMAATISAVCSLGPALNTHHSGSVAFAVALSLADATTSAIVVDVMIVLRLARAYRTSPVSDDTVGTCLV